MKRVLLAGLTERDAAAVETTVGTHWNDLRVHVLPRSLGVPSQDAVARCCVACVIDLFGLGMRKVTPDNERRLMEFLAGRSAVLLLRGDSDEWVSHDLSVKAQQKLVWLHMPCSSMEMTAALREVTAQPHAGASLSTREPSLVGPMSYRPSSDAVTSAGPEPHPPKQDLARESAPPPSQHTSGVGCEEQGGAAQRDIAVRDAGCRGDEGARHLHIPSGAPVASVYGAGCAWEAAGSTPVPLVNGQTLERLFGAFPLLKDLALARLLAKVVTDDSPKVLRVNDAVAVAAHVRQGWVFSKLPTTALMRLLRTPDLVGAIQVEALGPAQWDELLQAGTGHPMRRANTTLDEVTWDLVGEALAETRLVAEGDFSLRLHRFPNFTRLNSVDALDIQLAAICASMAQTVSGLKRAFPMHEQSVCRFVVLSVLSGLACVMPVPDTGAVPAPANARTPSRVGVRTGFFQSLLGKLF